MHHPLLHPRLVLLLLAAWAFAGTVRAKPFPDDPVEVLRQALRQDEKAPRDEAILKERKANLEKKAAEIRSLGDLGRALTLQEWTAKGLDPEINDAIWAELGRRFGNRIRKALKEGDPTRKQAAARLLAETATRARQGGIETQRVESTLPTFAPELIALTRSGDPAVAIAAMRTLGRINPDPKEAVPALERMLTAGSVGERRAAAEALLNMIQVAAEIVKKRQGDPANLVRTGRAAVLAASRGVEDSDTTVRRFCLDAIQQAALSLADQIIIPPPDTLNFPPPDRKVWASEEVERAQKYRKEVKDERALLRPLMLALRDSAAALSRALNDADPEVRLRARVAVADIGSADQKLLQRAASVPAIPPDLDKNEEEKKDEKKDEKKGEDKKGEARLPDLVPDALPIADVPPEDDALREGLRRTLANLTRAVFVPDVRNRLAAIDALEMMGRAATPAAPALVKALCDPDLFVRWAAARTLGKLAPAEAGPATRGLTELLCYPDLELRVVAATALQAYGPEARDAVPALIKAVLSKDDPDMRVAAIDALEAIGTDSAPAIPALIQVLSEGPPRVRRAAAALLGKFGPAARAAIPALRRALNDTDADTRKNASDALLNIER
jgi:HEAT repeat protein